MADDAKEKIWVKPVLAGVAVAILWKPLTGSTLTGALVAGIAATGIAHLVLSRMAGRKAEPDQPGTASPTAPAPEAPPEVAEAPMAPAASVAPETPVAPAAPAAPVAEPLVKPSKALPGEAELAARKGTWTYKAGPA